MCKSHPSPKFAPRKKSASKSCAVPAFHDVTILGRAPDAVLLPLNCPNVIVLRFFVDNFDYCVCEPKGAYLLHLIQSLALNVLPVLWRPPRDAEQLQQWCPVISRNSTGSHPPAADRCA